MTGGTIAALLDKCAAAHADRPLLRDTTGATLTVGEVAELTLAGTRWLGEVGVRPGMTVAWQLPSHVSAALLILSLARTRITQAPIIHICRRREVAAAIESSGADLLIVDESTGDNAPADARVVELPSDFAARLRELDRRPARELIGETAPGETRWIYFTSGTTGRPKAVRHSDATLLTAARGFTEHVGLGEHSDELGSIVFPIAHIGGSVSLAGALLANYPVLMVPKFAPEQLAGLLAAHKVTVTGASTAFYQLMLSAQLASGRAEPVVPSLRMLVGGGAACPPELHKRVREDLDIPIVHAYGMTEAAMVCVSKATDTEEQQSFSSGSPIPTVDVRIGERDEIEIRGGNVTPGYLDAEQWRAAVTPDGWFRTGDRGYLRPDGRIVLTGRTKDLIIRKGENIAPDEIESELLAHPLVDDVVVLGQPDELRGELVCAVVRRSPRHRDVTLDELCGFLDERGLMKQKWPERLVFVDEFPLTGLGKVAKTELARQLGVAR
jgi:cyclohexanecarboxylate-CoA ligase